ncbi:MAG: Lrp/AsnC family transcriptional regulator [Halobacteria archaeon]|nr:Lrp/AsnC family transcriptional regulator [Halobacteria archaeon]
MGNDASKDAVADGGVDEERKHDLVELLSEDARVSDSEIAHVVGVDEDDVEDLVEELEERGILRGYQAVVDWSKLESSDHEGHVRAEVEVNVSLDRETGYDDVAERIVGFPEVKSLRLVSGNYDFDLEIEGSSMSEVSNFVSEKIAPIPEITQTVTHFVMGTYKERGIEMRDGHDDDRLSVSP